jgi:hypothetical protein
MQNFRGYHTIFHGSEHHSPACHVQAEQAQERVRPALGHVRSSHCNTVTSLLDVPWMVVATVRSLAHVRSLEECGQVSPRHRRDGDRDTTTVGVVGVQEQHGSELAIHTIIGAALLTVGGRSLLIGVP